jgi:hypothetical protein
MTTGRVLQHAARVDNHEPDPRGPTPEATPEA